MAKKRKTKSKLSPRAKARINRRGQEGTLLLMDPTPCRPKGEGVEFNAIVKRVRCHPDDVYDTIQQWKPLGVFRPLFIDPRDQSE